MTSLDVTPLGMVLPVGISEAIICNCLCNLDKEALCM